jgi:hypothetical protein
MVPDPVAMLIDAVRETIRAHDLLPSCLEVDGRKMRVLVGVAGFACPAIARLP